MSSIPSINHTCNSQRPEIAGRIGPRVLDAATAAGSEKTDSVELSAEALTHTETPVDQARALRLAMIKHQIDTNSYDIDSKLALVATKLAKELG